MYIFIFTLLRDVVISCTSIYRYTTTARERNVRCIYFVPDCETFQVVYLMKRK